MGPERSDSFGQSRAAEGSVAWEDPEVSGPVSDVATDRLKIGEASRYQRSALLGRGGMGQVSSARDQRLERDVAIKEIPPDLQGTRAGARLAREAAISARLDHPAIVPVFDAGVRGDGTRWFAMRLVRGKTLAQVLGERPQSGPAVDLVPHLVTVCQAMAYAHSLGVIHRDLKPSNVLIGAFGETQVADWGLALWLTPEGKDRADLPAVDHGVVGTAGFMSPEQASGAAVTARSDVWSLGAVLVALLAPKAPAGEPAQRLDLAEGAPKELVAIARRAIEADPSRRYADGAALADELGRWQAGQRVLAYDYAPSELILRSLRKFWLPISIGSAGVVGVGLTISIGAFQTAQERDRAVLAEESAESARSASEESLAQALVAQSKVAVTRGQRAEAEVLATRALVHQPQNPIARGVLATYAMSERPTLLSSTPAPPCPMMSLGAQAQEVICLSPDGTTVYDIDGEMRWTSPLPGRFATGQGDGQGIVLTSFLGETTTHDPQSGGLIDLGPALTVHGVVASPQGTAVAAWAGDRVLHHSGPGQPWATWIFPCPGPARSVESAAFTDDGATLIAICHDGTLHIGPTGGPIARTLRTRTEALGWSGPGAMAVLDPDHIVVGTYRGFVGLIDLRDGATTEVARVSQSPILQLQVRGDQRQVLVLPDQRGPRLVALDSGYELLRLPDEATHSMRLVDGDVLWTLSDEVRSWRLPETAAPVWFPPAQAAGATVARLAPEVEALVVTRTDGPTAYALDDGRVIGHAFLGDGVIKDMDIHPDGRRAIFVGMGHKGHQELSLPELRPTRLGADQGNRRVTAYIDSDTLLDGGWEAAVGTLSLTPDTSTSTFNHPDCVVRDGHGISAERRAFALCESGAILRVDDHGLDEQIAMLPGALALSVDDSAENLAILHDQNVTIFALPSMASRSFRFEAPSPLTLALSKGAGLVAIGFRDGSAVVYDGTNGEVLAELRGHTDRVVSVRFEGLELDTASWDGSARRWGLEALRAQITDGQARDAEARWDLTVAEALVNASR